VSITNGNYSCPAHNTAAALFYIALVIHRGDGGEVKLSLAENLVGKDVFKLNATKSEISRLAKELGMVISSGSSTRRNAGIILLNPF